MENKWDRYDAAAKERERLFEEAQELFAESTLIHDKAMAKMDESLNKSREARAILDEADNV